MLNKLFCLQNDLQCVNKKGAQGTFKTSSEQSFLTIYCGFGPVNVRQGFL